MSKARVLIREDFNVPLSSDGQITDDSRITSALPSIQQYLAEGAQVILLSHLGRPKEGKLEPGLSLAPVAERLSELLALPVAFLTLEEAEAADFSQLPDVILLENVRFNVGEKSNSPILSKRYASLADKFVMDAFATSHRSESSTVGVAEYCEAKEAGPLLQKELSSIGKALDQALQPVVAIVGGSKVSTKITVLKHLLDKVDVLIVGGGMANTLLAASGVYVGSSLYEEHFLNLARDFLAAAKEKGVLVPLPVDVMVASEFSADANAECKAVTELADQDMILDIGPETIKAYDELVAKAKTIIWNGPLGVFEFANFAAGTKAIAKAIATSDAYSIAGGGDTVAAIMQFALQDGISYISTGGGAFLELVEGKTLPAVAALTA